MMSRSYKKTPYCGDRPSKNMKRLANKRVRQLLKNHEYSIHGKSFRKCFPTYDIRDYIEVGPSFEVFYQKQLEDWDDPIWSWWRSKGYTKPPSEEECRNLYEKIYKRK